MAGWEIAPELPAYFLRFSASNGGGTSFTLGNRDFPLPAWRCAASEEVASVINSAPLQFADHYRWIDTNKLPWQRYD